MHWAELHKSAQHRDRERQHELVEEIQSVGLREGEVVAPREECRAVGVVTPAQPAQLAREGTLRRDVLGAREAVDELRVTLLRLNTFVVCSTH